MDATNFQPFKAIRVWPTLISTKFQGPIRCTVKPVAHGSFLHRGENLSYNQDKQSKGSHFHNFKISFII